MPRATRTSNPDPRSLTPDPQPPKPEPPSPAPGRRSRATSPARAAANRSNAARSTGPRTAEGKARSAQNARKHGFTAADFTVPRLEDHDEIARLRADLFALYQPRNSQEQFALERMAMAQHMILRAARLESGLFAEAMNLSIDNPRPQHVMLRPLTGHAENGVTTGQHANFVLAEGFAFMHGKHPSAFSLLLRYQAQAERFYRRALEEFQRVRAEAPALPDSPAEPLPGAQTADDQPRPEFFTPPAAAPQAPAPAGENWQNEPNAALKLLPAQPVSPAKTNPCEFPCNQDPPPCSDFGDGRRGPYPNLSNCPYEEEIFACPYQSELREQEARARAEAEARAGSLESG